jgi:Flp pilus assembly protein TadG
MIGRPSREAVHGQGYAVGKVSRPGAAVVELAVLLPLLSLLFVIAVDFCRVYYHAQTLRNCAYAGALYASSTAERKSSTTAETAVKQAAVAEGR